VPEAGIAPATDAVVIGGTRRGGGGGGFGSGLDTATVRIYNAQNDLIRTLKWGVDSGYNKRYWSMEEKGMRQPGSPKPKPNDPEPGGDQVLPGVYKVVLQFKKEMDSSYVTIKADPRKTDNSNIRLAQKQMTKRLMQTASKLTTGMDMLNDAEEIAKKYEAQMKDVTGKDADSVRKQTKKMLDGIKDIRDFINGKRIERQGYGQIPVETVMTTLSEARFNIIGKNVAPGKQEELLVEKAEGKINETVKKINDFFGTKWSAYQALIEGSKVSLFKEFKPL
jgi:hypothetical protein